jgi:hypothetical protein
MGMGLLFSCKWSVVGDQNKNDPPLWFRVSGIHHLTEWGGGLTISGSWFEKSRLKPPIEEGRLIDCTASPD